MRAKIKVHYMRCIPCYKIDVCFIFTPNAGYSTYIAILYLEFTQNNPIANCFAQILLEECATKNTFDKPVRCNRTFHKGK